MNTAPKKSSPTKWKQQRKNNTDIYIGSDGVYECELNEWIWQQM